MRFYKLSRLFMLTICIISLLHSAHANRPVRNEWMHVTGHIADKSEKTLGNQIIFIFDEELADYEGDPLILSPSMGGAFSRGPNYVVFKSEALTRFRSVRVELRDNLQGRYSGKAIDPAHRHWRIGYLTVMSQGAAKKSSGLHEGFINFSDPVMPEAVLSALQLTTTDGNTTLTCNRLSQPNRPTTNVQFSFDPGDAFYLNLSLDDSLRDATGELSLIENWRYKHTLRPYLKVIGTNWLLMTKDLQRIGIDFSHLVEPDRIKELLTLESEQGVKLPFKIIPARTNQNLVLEFQLKDLSDPQVKVLIDKSLTGSLNSAMSRSESLTLKPQIATPQIRSYYYTDFNGQRAVSFHIYNGQPEIASIRKHMVIEPNLDNMRLISRSNQDYYILGDWVPNVKYTITLTPGLLIDAWYTTTQKMSFSITSSNPDRKIAFKDPKQYYFARGGRPSLELESTQISKANLTISRMFPGNIVRAMDYLSDGQGGASFSAFCAEPLLTSETTLNRHDYLPTTTTLHLEEWLKEGNRGLFCVEARADTCYASKLALITEIGLLAHWQNDQALVFAHDLKTLKPISQAKISLYSVKQQLLGQVYTNAQGIAEFPVLTQGLGAPTVAVAEKGNDYTFIQLAPRNDEEAPFSGKPAYNPAAYDGFIYADRELYRPGDDIHLRVISRVMHGLAPLANIPLQVTIYKPNKQELVSCPITLSEYGTASLDLTTKKEYPTGRYRIALRVPSSKKDIATSYIQIETYVPARMKALMKVADRIWTAGSPTTITIQAEQLHGGPAPDRKAIASIFFEKGARLEGFASYIFDNKESPTPAVIQLGEKITDKQGIAHYTTILPASSGVTAPMNATATASVYELGGRAVRTVASAVYFPDKIALGLEPRPKENSNQMEIAVIALTVPDMRTAPLKKVKVTLERMNWTYYWRRYYGYYGSNWTRDYEISETRDVSLTDGKGTVSFDIPSYGGYRVRVTSEETKLYCETEFRKNYYDQGFDLSDAKRDSIISVRADRDKYAPGDTAYLTIESPFEGRAVVVLQGNRLKRLITRELKSGQVIIPVPVTTEDSPNIWAEVTVIHKVTPDAVTGFPYSGFAAANITVLSPETEIIITADNLPEAILPDTTFTLTLRAHTGENLPAASEFTLALVDEGIHLLTNYQKPDPAAHLFRARAPHPFNRAHYYDRVNYDFSPPATGGGSPSVNSSDSEMAKRQGAERETWIKSIALWTGAVRTNADGATSISLRVPEFTGQLRLVAIAVSQKGVGAWEEKLFVRRPFMLRSAMPRFLLTGDKAECRATVFNTTSQSRMVRISWKADGKLIQGEGARLMQLPAESECSVLAQYSAGNRPGSGEINWKADILSKDTVSIAVLTERAPMPVNAPSHLFQSFHETATVLPGETSVFVNSQMLEDERVETEMSVSFLPLLKLERSLRYVIGYPYGCVEQTTSRCFPLFTLRRTRQALRASLDEQEKLDDMLQSGIDRLFTMQTAQGGLAFWPGGREPYDYGAIYAGHFLTAIWLTKEYDIPNDNYLKLLDYLKVIAKESSVSQGQSQLFLRAYATYVLALAADKEAPELIERFDHIREMNRSGRNLLSAAFALTSRDMKRVQDYMENHPGGDWNEHEIGGTLQTKPREDALNLMAMRAAEYPNDKIDAAAKELLDNYTVFHETHGPNTHSSAFILVVMGDYLADLADNIKSGAFGQGLTVKWNEGERALLNLEVFNQKRMGPESRFVIENKSHIQANVNWIVKGVPKKLDPRATSNGISIKRVFLDREGNTLQVQSFKQAETIVAGIEFRASKDLQNLVIADLFPAGLEIENPRIAPETLLRMGLKNFDPGYFDLRDDRLILFYEKIKANQTYKYCYVVVPVTPGEFTYPPAQAECMYAPKINGRTAAGIIEVTP